ncbi:MAG: valine--tRNA ligase [Chloroflexi bacterium]|nr:valine--tRNA ligase [Chloroflexota bacterium]
MATTDRGWVKPIDVSALPNRFEPEEAEPRWRAHWDELGIHRYDPSRPREETFVVDTPPPTASGSLHVGHVFSYTHQDLIVRYQRMRGRNIFYPMGWDDNGLPTERRVQNVFNVRSDPYMPFDPDLAVDRVDPKTKPRDLPRPTVISRRNFIDLCHIVTAEDEVAFKGLWEMLGLSVDWNEEYATIDHRSRAMAQRSFLDLYEKGHIYQVEAPTMWDVDFATAVAQAEVEDRERDGAFHDIEFATEEGGSFVISTTRPELLAACVGIAAHPDDERYKGLFGKLAISPIYRVPVPIFPTELADPEKGTGVLMVCTFGDQTDVQWWREEGLALRQVLGRDGLIVDRRYGDEGWESNDPELANVNYAEIVGKRVNQARRIVVEQLRDPANSAMAGGDAPLQGEPRPIKHAVRFFEKGDSPLEYLTSRQWFVRLMDKKDELIRMGRQIKWHPAHMGKRYENWTENLQLDWAISRQRYFGVQFPVWYRLDDQGNPIYESLIVATPEMLPMDPMSDTAPGFAESQRGQPGGFAGEPDVFDTWFTSSLTPQIGARWGEDGDKMDRLFPMDVRPQAHDIIRTWAFYTIAKSLLHHGDVPWRNVVLSGWILDPDRKKMSKSRGNVVTPTGMLEEYGADAVRYWAGSARLGADTAFDEQVFKVGKRLVTKIYNAGKFVLSQEGPEGEITNELDRAFIAELAVLVDRTTRAFDEFEYSRALEETETFFWSAFTDNYLELVKRRSRSEEDPEGRASAIATLRTGLNVLMRLFAPFVPTITDEVWSWAFAGETGHRSIHVADWPSSAEFATVPAPADAGSFALACDAITAVRKAKTDEGLGMGRPLTSLALSGTAEDLSALARVINDVRDSANASDIGVTEGDAGGERFAARIEAEVQAAD